MNKRTIIRFTPNGNISQVFNGWASANGFNVVSTNELVTVFQKGVGLMVAPMMLQVTQLGNDIELQAWVRVNLFNRICSFFMLPAEMSIESSGGFRGVIPRQIARKAINVLLTMLNVPLIQ